MAMSASAMAAAMNSHMPPLAEAEAQQARLASLTAIAQGIIEHIQAAAVVAVPGTGLVAPGGGGPVTGAGVGSIT